MQIDDRAQITKDILKIAFPAAVGFFFHTMFNVVDTYFAGMLNTGALAGLSVSFPIFFMVIAVSNGLGTAVSSLMANYLGAKKDLMAKEVLMQSCMLGIIMSILIGIVGILVTPFLLNLLGAGASYQQYSKEYLQVIFIGSFSFIYFSIFNSALVALGDSKKFRNALIFGFVLNIILNPLLMFVFGMGIRGLALATVIAESLQAMYLFRTLTCLDYLKKDCFQKIPTHFNHFPDIIKHGGFAALNMLTIGVGIFVILSVIAKAGAQAVAAYGIGIRIEQIVLLPAIGLGMATNSLVGRYNGAGEINKLRLVYRQALLLALMNSVLGCILIAAGKGTLVSLFSSDYHVQEIAKEYLVFASFLLFVYAVIMISNSVFFALKHSYWPMIIGLLRQIIIPLSILAIFFQASGLTGIWWGILLNNTLMALITFLIARKYLVRNPNL